MRRPLACASPFHVGDRYIASRFDAFERCTEFRRMRDRGREAVILDRIVCRECLRREVLDRRGDAPVTAQLFD